MIPEAVLPRGWGCWMGEEPRHCSGDATGVRSDPLAKMRCITTHILRAALAGDAQITIGSNEIMNQINRAPEIPAALLPREPSC